MANNTPLLVAGGLGLLGVGAVWLLSRNGGGAGVSGRLSEPFAIVRANVANGASTSVRVTNNGGSALDYAVVTEIRTSGGQPLMVAPANFGSLPPGQSIVEKQEFNFLLPSPIQSGSNYRIEWQLFRRPDNQRLATIGLSVAAMGAYVNYARSGLARVTR